MENEEYARLAARTNSKVSLYLGDETADLIHAAIGAGTEAGELLDQVKRHLFYDAPLDRINVIEECGDILWYVALALRSVDSTFGEAMEKNIAKLAKRYPEKFTTEKAVTRDLAVERKVLEGAGDV